MVKSFFAFLLGAAVTAALTICGLHGAAGAAYTLVTDTQRLVQARAAVAQGEIAVAAQTLNHGVAAAAADAFFATTLRTLATPMPAKGPPRAARAWEAHNQQLTVQLQQSVKALLASNSTWQSVVLVDAAGHIAAAATHGGAVYGRQGPEKDTLPTLQRALAGASASAIRLRQQTPWFVSAEPLWFQEGEGPHAVAGALLVAMPWKSAGGARGEHRFLVHDGDIVGGDIPVGVTHIPQALGTMLLRQTALSGGLWGLHWPKTPLFVPPEYVGVWAERYAIANGEGLAGLVWEDNRGSYRAILASQLVMLRICGGVGLLAMFILLGALSPPPQRLKQLAWAALSKPLSKLQAEASVPPAPVHVDSPADMTVVAAESAPVETTGKIDATGDAPMKTVEVALPQSSAGAVPPPIRSSSRRAPGSEPQMRSEVDHALTPAVATPLPAAAAVAVEPSAALAPNPPPTAAAVAAEPSSGTLAPKPPPAAPAAARTAPAPPSSGSRFSATASALQSPSPGPTASSGAASSSAWADSRVGGALGNVSAKSAEAGKSAGAREIKGKGVDLGEDFSMDDALGWGGSQTKPSLVPAEDVANPPKK